jgi:hypothetical protein
MIYLTKYPDFPEHVLDHLLFGHETRTSVLREEIFFLKKELLTAEAYIVPFLQELIQEKESCRAKIVFERSF